MKLNTELLLLHTSSCRHVDMTQQYARASLDLAAWTEGSARYLAQPAQQYVLNVCICVCIRLPKYKVLQQQQQQQHWACLVLCCVLCVLGPALRLPPPTPDPGPIVISQKSMLDYCCCIVALVL